LPTDLRPGQNAALDALSNLGGVEFNRAYRERNVEAHERDVDRFELASTREQDASRIRQFAAAKLPVLSPHLESAR
jgi:predicted outer membrane protein